MLRTKPRMRMITAALVTALLAGVAPGSADTFDRGRASYRTAGGTWTKAAIEISPGTLEIHSPRGARRSLVGRFGLGVSGDSAKTVSLERQIDIRRRTGAGLKIGIIGGGIVGGLWAGLKPALTRIAESRGARQSDIRQVEEQYWDKYAPKVFGSLLGVVGVVAIVRGLSKTDGPPYWRVSETSEQGTRSMEIRVSNKDMARFEQALMNNRLNDLEEDDDPEHSPTLRLTQIAVKPWGSRERSHTSQ